MDVYYQKLFSFPRMDLQNPNSLVHSGGIVFVESDLESASLSFPRFKTCDCVMMCMKEVTEAFCRNN